ncbi:phage N-6-adenine-methyltransferase [Puia dinghuensis]|uniref:phage N-6-adenine-methyltransferase n=1 Tax=Puia dinghuensis TaxID=1792502 RepID=UPI001E404547|nr:phage N-6-adenine-methyltransferase [Puia dinghuensis]
MKESTSAEALLFEDNRQIKSLKKKKKKGMGSHQSAHMETDIWLTDPKIIHANGVFDLDPCAPAHRPWDMAKVHYCLPQNGLLLPWFGRVWLNPPYGNLIGRWMAKMALHGNGISLIFARTETSFFQNYVWPYASSILFIKGRLHFYTEEGIRAPANGGAPSILIAYGRENVESLGDSGIKGHHQLVNAARVIVVGISPTWKSVVSIVIDRLKGEAALQQVYDIAQLTAPDKCANNNHWKETIRRTLQEEFQRIAKGVYTHKRKPMIEQSSMF